MVLTSRADCGQACIHHSDQDQLSCQSRHPLKLMHACRNVIAICKALEGLNGHAALCLQAERPQQACIQPKPMRPAFTLQSCKTQTCMVAGMGRPSAKHWKVWTARQRCVSKLDAGRPATITVDKTSFSSQLASVTEQCVCFQEWPRHLQSPGGFGRPGSAVFAS